MNFSQPVPANAVNAAIRRKLQLNLIRKQTHNVAINQL